MADIAPEGIVISSVTGWVDETDLYGLDYGTEVRSLSKSVIETIDLLSEGKIGGLTSGTYLFSGTLGEIGWDNAIFSGFDVGAGLDGLGYLKSIYWNEVPVMDSIGNLNFQDVDITWSEGSQNGKLLETLSPYQKVSKTINERLYDGEANSKYYRILNKDCRGVVVNIGFPALSYTDALSNIARTGVSYSISYRPILSRSSIDFISRVDERVFGKISNSRYVRTKRIDFSSEYAEQADLVGWEVKITRDTEDSADPFIRSSTVVDSLTEIQRNIYSFPNSATVRNRFDAEFFQSVPERAFEIQGIEVKIPGNYDPILRKYLPTGFATSNGGWDGTFATGRYYTNNPAWCYYDLLTSPRYGLGKYIPNEYVDKWALYEIGKYCDQLVLDEYGSLEPRFTSNLWITTREEAYKVMQDMSSIFRGLSYYSNGGIFAVQDSPKDAIVTFTNANVSEGNFIYSTSSKRSRHSVALVRYNDPKNFYKPTVVYIEDFNAIRKYGIKEIEVTAFGCTSRGQATRLGRWILASDNLEPEVINFTAGLESNYLRPGDVFKVFDANRKVKRYGGRTNSIADNDGTGSSVSLDSKIDLESGVLYDISFVTPSYSYSTNQVTGLEEGDISSIRKSFVQKFTFSGAQSYTSGNVTNLNLYSGFNYDDYMVSGGCVWVMELNTASDSYTGSRYFTNKSYDYYRVLNIKEDEPHKYTIEGLQYNVDKFGKIESGLMF